MSIVQQIPALRWILERVSRGRRVKRTLPNGVKLYVSPDAQLKYLYAKFDVDLTRLAEAHIDESSVVWDIGSNCGVFAFSANRAREIVAVEADPFLANLIQESICMNRVPVSLVAVAASSEMGLASFSIASRGRASNHLSHIDGRSQTGGERARLLVSTITLDQLLNFGSPPTLIKIDVEGAEVDVLKGAESLLREVRPLLYLETSSESHEACAAILERHGYSLAKGAEMNWLCTPGPVQAAPDVGCVNHA